VTRTARAAAALVFLAGVVVQAQRPPIQNGRVEQRTPADLAAEVGAIAAQAAEPVWVGWRVPIAGVRTLCSWYVDDTVAVRGFLASTGDPGAPSVPQITAPEGPVPIEAGTGLVVLLRLNAGRVERLRTLTDDCPIDAGGRTIHWFEGLSAPRSLAYLDTHARLDDAGDLDRQTMGARRSLAQSAVSAMALHADTTVASALLAVIARGSDAAVTRRAVQGLAGLPEHAGVAHLIALARTSADQAVRRDAVTELGRIKDPRAIAYLAEVIGRN
jgi:hypothetical protein